MWKSSLKGTIYAKSLWGVALSWHRDEQAPIHITVYTHTKKPNINEISKEAQLSSLGKQLYSAGWNAGVMVVSHTLSRSETGICGPCDFSIISNCSYEGPGTPRRLKQCTHRHWEDQIPPTLCLRRSTGTTKAFRCNTANGFIFQNKEPHRQKLARYKYLRDKDFSLYRENEKRIKGKSSTCSQNRELPLFCYIFS